VGTLKENLENFKAYDLLLIFKTLSSVLKDTGIASSIYCSS